MRRLVLLTVLALETTAAEAESGRFYLGAGVTHSSLTEYFNNSTIFGPTDFNKNSWKAFAGVRPLNWLAVEADYIDLGSGSSGTTVHTEGTDSTHADSSAWAVYAVGFLPPLPVPAVDFYGKVGVARWKLNISFTQDFFFPPPASIVTTRSYSGTDFAWGIGVQAHVKMFGVRLEYEGFEVDNHAANVASLSVFLNL